MTQYSTIDSLVGALDRDVLISIHPEPARKLYAGTKTYELRKVAPKAVPRRVFLYEANARRLITGHLVVERVLVAPPDQLWDDLGSAASPRKRFFEYFRDKTLGYAFQVRRAVQWSSPVDPTEVECVSAFRPSQNFLYLDNLPGLQTVLRQRLFDAALDIEQDGLRLQVIDSAQANDFIENVDRHISGSYLDTGDAYGQTLLDVAEKGEDPEGIFTVRKIVLQIILQNEFVGYVVLTEKLGGSLKTGPTILLKNFRARGIGRRLRSLLREIGLRAGLRKIYCTAPMSNAVAIRYLTGAGYRLEAHLRRHYHTDHDEFVFGDMLSRFRAPPLEFIRPVTSFTDFRRLKAFSDEVVHFINQEFSATYCHVDREWASRQVRAAASFAKGRGPNHKPRLVYVGRGLSLLCVALCVVKRGGAVKILLLSRSCHRRSIEEFLTFVQASIERFGRFDCRKLYAHLALSDVDLVEAFLSVGFESEGVLARPYNDSTDMLVVGKPLKEG